MRFNLRLYLIGFLMGVTAAYTYAQEPKVKIIAAPKTEETAEQLPPPTKPKLAAGDTIDIDVLPQDGPRPWVEKGAQPAGGDMGLSKGVGHVIRSAVPVKWELVDDGGATLTPETDGKSAVFAAAEDGSYRILAIGADGTTSRLSILVGKRHKTPIVPPDPNPTPVPPAPGPQPQPIVGVAKFVVAEDSSKAGPWRGAIFGNPKVMSFYSQLQGTSTTPVHRIVDVNDNVSTEPVTQYFVKAAAGKPLPYLWLLDSTGKIVSQQQFPSTVAAPAFVADPDAFIALFNLHPEKRAMGLVRQAPKLKWKKFGDSPNVPIIPRTEWPQGGMSMTKLLGPVHDQDGVGQCASSAATGVAEFVRNQVGLPYQYLSAGDLYSRVNGGRDDGSTLEDNMSEMVSNGVSLASSVPYVWNGKRPLTTTAIVNERAQFKDVEVYLCPDFDSMVSAILQGFVVQHGVLWYDNFTPDAQGWLPAKGRGGSGGHSRFAYGVAFRNGVWGVVTRNSWGASWGGSADGTVQAGSSIDPESIFDGSISGYYAVRAVTQTPVPGWTVPSAMRSPFAPRDPLKAKVDLVLKP